MVLSIGLVLISCMKNNNPTTSNLFIVQDIGDTVIEAEGATVIIYRAHSARQRICFCCVFPFLSFSFHEPGSVAPSRPTGSRGGAPQGRCRCPPCWTRTPSSGGVSTRLTWGWGTLTLARAAVWRRSPACTSCTTSGEITRRRTCRRSTV